MKQPARPCSACHGPRTGVITETFTDDASAFRRHAQLVQSGRAPSLCMQRDGTRNVCHLAETAKLYRFERKASETERPLLVAAAVEIAAHA